METIESILAAARKAPTKEQDLKKHDQAIVALREKGYTWREIAAFLNKHGVVTDHTKLIRFMQKATAFTVPPANDYRRALTGLQQEDTLTATHWAMLKFHFEAHNRTVTYTQLARAAEANGAKLPAERPHSYANLHYGNLAKALGHKLGSSFTFLPSTNREEPFYSSAIGLENPAKAPGADFELVMHHELAKAIELVLNQQERFNGDPEIFSPATKAT